MGVLKGKSHTCPYNSERVVRQLNTANQVVWVEETCGNNGWLCTRCILDKIESLAKSLFYLDVPKEDSAPKNIHLTPEYVSPTVSPPDDQIKYWSAKRIDDERDKLFTI